MHACMHACVYVCVCLCAIACVFRSMRAASMRMRAWVRVCVEKDRECERRHVRV